MLWGCHGDTATVFHRSNVCRTNLFKTQVKYHRSTCDLSFPRLNHCQVRHSPLSGKLYDIWILSSRPGSEKKKTIQMRTTTSLQETISSILPGVCVAAGWKMDRHSTDQPKLAGHITSRDTIPAKQRTVCTWWPVASVLPSTLDRLLDWCGRDTTVTGVKWKEMKKDRGPLLPTCPGSSCWCKQ